MTDKAKFDLEQTKFWHGIRTLLRALLVISAISTIALVVTGVVFRYILRANFFGGEEIIVTVGFWLYFLGAMYGSLEKSHIKADMVNTLVKNKRVRDGVNLIAAMITCFVCIVFTIWGFEFLMWDIAMMPRTTALRIPLFIPRSAIFVGYVVMTFYHLYYLQRDIRAFFSGENYIRNIEGDAE